MILSIDAEKGFGKIQPPLMLKAVKKLGMEIEGKLFNIIKAIANIILNGEQLKPFLLQSGMRQGVCFSHCYSV
jgi:hypothetical protein